MRAEQQKEPMMDHYDELSALFNSPDGDMFKSAEKKQVLQLDSTLIDNFARITKFVEQHDRLPRLSGEDIQEKLLAKRLETIKSNKDQAEKLREYDSQGILEDEAPKSLDDLFANDNDLFADKDGLFKVGDLPDMSDRRVVENAASAVRREKCEDFDKKYRDKFIEQQRLLRIGERKLTPFMRISDIKPGCFYVYDGQMCYVVSFGEIERKAGGYHQQRIEVVFENGMRSNMYKRSLAQRLYEGGLVVVNNEYTRASVVAEESIVGRIYVLQSLSNDPAITTIKDLHKIGFTTTSMARRLQNAENDPTYLMAPVKVIETYAVTGSYNPHKIEDMIHHFFADTKVDMEIIDNNGRAYIPQEWYSVPLAVVREAVDMIGSREILNYIYDPKAQAIVER